MRFKVVDKVKLNRNIKKFEYGKAGVGYDEIGIITLIMENGYIFVDFPNQSWGGLEQELVLVDRKKFFKRLPNDFTGTLEVKNGYIVEKEILNEVEKKYLSNAIKTFRNKVESISKQGNFGDTTNYIEIELPTEIVCLPCFKKGSMYNGMEEAREYTLEELGL